ncbi:MAG TPA: dihydrolipoamide acetyltransferase family protein [Anaerolineales bacterium]|nr:dihydrolipoamide acetyltransferase family protein [Anaerolineales bacterium]
MPALGMAQETGKLVSWLKQEGERVEKGQALMEIETDKATVEIEAPATGLLRGIRVMEGQDVPVGDTVAWILEPGEALPAGEPTTAPTLPAQEQKAPATAQAISPLARKIAQEHQVDLAQVKSDGGRIQKKDILAYLDSQTPETFRVRLVPASPKARRLAEERDIDISALTGSGPDGAVLAADVLFAQVPSPAAPALAGEEVQEISTIWRRMSERVTQSWVSVPHFYLQREADASRLGAWRELAQKRSQIKLTFTDLLVKLAAAALRGHPRLVAHWQAGEILSSHQINIGLAIAVEDGLVVPVIHGADTMSLSQIAERRQELLGRAREGKLRLEDLQGGTFTISNLGMYGIDVFNAIVNPPQAAILAVGRIADRVVPVDGIPGVRPMMTLSLSCDHRVVDGARGAQFLHDLVAYIEEPLALLE